MKISRKWLNDYIVSKKTDDELVDAFTQLGLECTVEKNNLIDSNVVIGKVEDCIKHPNADRLKVCKVNVGRKKILTIVCGAPNISKNITVPVAKIGSKLGEFKISRTKIRDVVSEGMICSGKELGLNNDYKGIMILDNKLKAGEALNQALSLNESILDFDITPNRGDCFSHLGISRELSIIENKRINTEKVVLKGNNFSTKDLINVNVKDTTLCPRYACRVIKNIKVKESPQWLKNRLALIGQKSINNVVDLANYIMFDLGQPLHTFDYDKLNGSIIEVRLAKKNEEILCLNDELKKLSVHDIVIADSKGPIAIAGVIGGLYSHVDTNTTNILLESAVFNEVNIRKTSKKYEYAKEASKRFERGVDYNNVIYAMDKFSKILIEISGGEASNDFIDITKKMYGICKNKNSNLREIQFNSQSCNSFLGTELKESEFKEIFSKLFIDIEINKNDYICTVPSYRNDLEREIDLYEEVARVYGYDNIPSKSDFIFSSKSLVKDENSIEDKIKSILSNNGFNEHYSNSLYNKTDTEFLKSQSIQIKNPLSQDMSFLRSSLAPGILKALSYNEKRDNGFLKYYEIGSINIFSSKEYNLSIEKRELCIGYLDNEIKSWKNKQSFDLFDVKGDLKMLAYNLGIEDLSYNIEDNEALSISVKDKKIGKVFYIDDKLKNSYDIENNVILAILDLHVLSELHYNKNTEYKKIIPYPRVNRDIAILIKNNIKHSEIQNVIYDSSKSILKTVSLFDIYQDKSLGSNIKSMAYSLEFQSNSRTLTVVEVDKEIKKIMKQLKSKFNASQR